MTYILLCHGKTDQEIREIDLLLAPPEEKQRTIDQQNAEAMRMMGIGQVGPKPRPRGG